MMGFGRTHLEVPCTIEIEHTAQSLHAHVELDTPVPIDPGDEIHVHGAPVETHFGERVVLHRTATITRVGPVQRWITRALAYLELTELYEVGFSARRSS